MPSLDMLPVELLHRIFDNLDTENILFSMQYVCKRFHSITKNYNRYKLNFKSIFKHKFHQLCRATSPTNVISLTLSDENQTPGQIGLFLSLNRIEEYTRLQSIVLISIEDLYLNIILEHLSTTCLLTSLEIRCELNSILSKETLLFLSLIIGKNSLCKLDLTLGGEIINTLEWPEKCWIQYLRICSSISFDKFCTILRCSPHLKTMILHDCIINNTDAPKCTLSETTSYQQLTSLTLLDSDLEMPMIELLLSFTPSLIHLTLTGNGPELFDGARWEQFIQMKLPDLDKFEFAFQNHIGINCDAADFNSVIAPFQTPFWLQTKQWFVTALGVKTSPFLNLYTLPDCTSKINFYSKASKISRSTAPMMTEDLIAMDRVREITVDLMEMQADMTENVKKELSTPRLFNKLTKLILRFGVDWPYGSLELLLSFIDLSTITELILDGHFTQSDSLNKIAGITALLKQTSSIRSLIIPTQTVALRSICLIVSYHIQHLQIPVNDVKDMTIILKEFDHLSSVTFKFVGNSLNSISEIIAWLVAKDTDFTYQSTQNSLSLWFGKTRMKSF